MLKMKTLKKAISSVTMFATVVCLSGVSMLAPLAVSAATIVDGALISSNATNSDGTPTYESLDTYIVKIVGTKKFKRLVLNPTIFNSYGHLKWSDIQEVDESVLDEYETSSLARVDGDDKVYALTPDDDAGSKSWINMSAEDFLSLSESDPDSIYTINSVDAGTYSAKADLTTVSQLEAFYEDGTLPEEATDGALKVALSSNTPESANVPAGVGIEMLKFNLSASTDGDVTVSSITLTAGGLGDTSLITGIALYDENGSRINSTLKNINADKEANINTNGFVVEAGTTETVTVKAKTAATSQLNLGIKEVADIVSDATSTSGSFPVTGNDFTPVTASGLATLTVAADGTPSDVSLGDQGATIAKFKITNNDNEDSTISKIALKRNSSISNAAADDDFENLALYSGSTKIASADAIEGKYLTFVIEDGIIVPKNQTKKFTVRADVIDGAGKDIQLYMDNAIDIDAMGANYASIVAGTYAGAAVTINAGAVTLEKVNAISSKARPDTDNVEFGTFKVTANSGEEVKISSLKFQITSTGDSVVGDEFAMIENVEVYDVTDGIVYDTPYISSTGNTVKIYGDTSIDLYMDSGETHELVVRADVKAAATTETYTVAITDASTQLIIKETADETTLSDITPNAVSLSKITIEAAGVTLSVNPLSAAKTAVVGSTVEAINFNIEASEVSAIKVTELKFIDTIAPTTFNNTLVSGFTLYEDGVSEAIKSVGTSSLAEGEVTFGDLEINIAAGDSVKYYVTLDLVKDSTNTDTMKLRLSGYSIEENTSTSSDSLYDTVAENVLADGVVAAGETGATSLLSARTITAVGIGSLNVSVDNTDTKTDADIYAVAGTSTPELAALKLKADNEDVLVTAISVTANNANAASIISELSLVESDGTVIMTKTSGIGATTVFDLTGLTAGGYVVGQTEQIVFLKAKLQLIGKDQVGIDDQTSITFNFGAVEAEGYDSGDDLTADIVAGVIAGEIAYDHNANGTFGEVDDTATTAESKALGVLASRISSVELVSSYSGTTVASQIAGTGEYNVAIIKVTTDASSNTLTTGNSVKTIIDQIKLEVNKNATTMALSGMTLQKIGGNGIAIVGADGASNAFDAGVGLGYVTFDTVGDATFGTDEEFAPSTTSYYVVKATVSALEALTGNDWIRIDLDLLNGADGDADATGANFSWKDSSDASSKFPLRLEGTSSIDGTKINEQS